ncbi:predicted protein [Naegleria gruberi]|uniref:Predicted protein n=1 Tax=Naegleria gruberi TaxID=5762 RepID=D2V9J5_NAEGR|nr:uncharacterized protein NAEGRDRAFT_65465 [Naegleria gruberi]EFC46474.1 predicted protein [Naegleria gruberi]|eukprot:XP_002679218.1 predicted protein [Naegleria gruberi strain NEG-M]
MQQAKKSHFQYISTIAHSGFITDVKICLKHNLLLLVNYSSGTVMVHNLTTREKMFDVNVGGYCYYVALDYTDPDCTLPCIISTSDSYGDCGLRKHSLDTKQLIWKGPCTLSSARGLYVDQEKKQVYVTERDSGLLRVFSCVDGSLVTQFKVGAVTDVTMSLGTLVVCDKDAGCIKFLSPTDGSLIRKIGENGESIGKLNYPRGVIVDPITRNLIVSDSDNHRIQIFTWNGEYLESVGKKGSGEAELNTPFGIVLNSITGELFVSDCYNYRVIVFKYDSLISGKSEVRFKNMLSKSLHESLLSDIEFSL